MSTKYKATISDTGYFITITTPASADLQSVPNMSKYKSKQKAPLKDKIVANPENYVFSSARNYASLDNELEVLILNVF